MFTLLDCKWKNWKWNWGIITDHTHLTTSCPKLAELRVKTIKHFEIWKIEDLAEILKERGIKRKKFTLMEIETALKDFEVIWRGILQ